MRFQIAAATAVLGLAIIPAAPAQLSAQNACIVPGTGNVYAVGEVNTPTGCRTGHQGTSFGLTLPFYRELDATGALLNLNHLGSYAAARLTSATGSALNAEAYGNNNTIRAVNTGTGGAGFFQSTGAEMRTLFVRNIGTGGAGHFTSAANGPTVHIDNTGTGGVALFATTAGGHPTAYLEHTGATEGRALGLRNMSAWHTMNVHNAGAGGAAQFSSSRTTGSTVDIGNNSTTTGNAMHASSSGEWTTVDFRNHGTTGGAIYALSAGTHPTVNFRNNGAGQALTASTNNTGSTVYLQNENTGEASALNVQGHGVWAAAHFQNSNGDALSTLGSANIIQDRSDRAALTVTNNGGGNALNTNGNVHIGGALHVNGNYSASGTKNAVVETSSGKRLMYTEEATEVWFTDYGFGQLVDGQVWVEFDAVYAETANLGEAYHVFLQAYGPEELYVTDRTAKGFRVKAKDGKAVGEFSYRIVAKRMNYEGERLRPVGGR